MEQESNNKKPKYSYYKTHKEKFNIYTDCECGSRYCKNTKYNHFNSAKHINAMKIIEQQKTIIKLLGEQLENTKKNL